MEKEKKKPYLSTGFSLTEQSLTFVKYQQIIPNYTQKIKPSAHSALLAIGTCAYTYEGMIKGNEVREWYT